MFYFVIEKNARFTNILKVFVNFENAKMFVKSLKAVPTAYWDDIEDYSSISEDFGVRSFTKPFIVHENSFPKCGDIIAIVRVDDGDAQHAIELTNEILN